MTPVASERPPEAALPILATAGFASMLAMRMCDAMLPALGESFAVPAAQASATISGFAIAYGLMQLLAGPLGDRFGKPRVIALAALLCGLFALGAAAAPSLGALVLGRALMGGAAAGIIPLTMAWVGDQVPWERRQLVLARLLAYTVGGMTAGAWAGGVMADTLGWRWAFVGVALLLLGAAAGIHWRGPPAEPSHAVSSVRAHLQQMGSIVGNGWAQRLYAVTAIEGALVFGITAFVPIVLHERFALPLSSAGAVLALFGLGGFVYAGTAGRLLAWLPPPRLALAGGVLLCAAFLTLALMPHWAWAMPACALGGLGFYALHATLQTCATQLSTRARGTAVSLFAGVLFIGQSAGVAAMAAAVSRGWSAPVMGAGGVLLLVLAATFSRWLRAAAPGGSGAPGPAR